MSERNIYIDALKLIQKKRDLALILIIIVMGIGVSSISPIIYGSIIDSLTIHDISNFYDCLVLFVLITIFSILLNLGEEFFSQYICNKYIAYHQEKLYQRILNIAFSDVEELSIGYMMANLTSDISTIIYSDIKFISTGILACMNLIIPLLLMIKIQNIMAILALLFFPITFFCSLLFKKYKRKSYQKSAEADDHFYSFIGQSLNFLPEIKGLNQEHTFCNSAAYVIQNVKKADNKKNLTDYAISLSDNLLQNIFSFIIISVAAKYIFDSSLTVGVLLTFNIYMSRLFSSISSFKEIQLGKQPLKVAFDRIKYLLNYEHIDENKLIVDKNQFNNVRIERMAFGYKENENILNELNLDIQTPGFYSIVGKNGCGKTTLLKLIDAIYKPQKGKIYIGSYDYAIYDETEIRTQITYITKKCLIVYDSFLENIRLYHQNSIEEVVRVCEIVGLMDYVNGLSKGLNSLIDPDNDNLSSGMKQRINIARILLNPTPIILLDEITSDLDGEAEDSLVSNLIGLSQNHIIISISHRVEAIKNSKTIYFMRNGKLSANGTYSELCISSLEFRELFVHN